MRIAWTLSRSNEGESPNSTPLLPLPSCLLNQSSIVVRLTWHETIAEQVDLLALLTFVGILCPHQASLGQIYM